jgi:hypothetical protein
LNDLREEVVNYPDKFTKDLSFMLEKYWNYLVPVAEYLQQ